jgi:hypothetical protein
MRDIGRRGMSEFDSGDGGIVHDAPDADQDTSYGQDDVIVAEYTDGSQVGVVDTNHDHYADLLAVDRDGDGHPEVVYTNEHGGRALDTATYDYDEDGRPDVIIADSNYDGTPDTVHYGDTDRNPLGDASSVDPYASH